MTSLEKGKCLIFLPKTSNTIKTRGGRKNYANDDYDDVDDVDDDDDGNDNDDYIVFSSSKRTSNRVGTCGGRWFDDNDYDDDDDDNDSNSNDLKKKTFL